MEEPTLINIGSVVSSLDSFKADWAFFDLDEIAIAEQAYVLYMNRANMPVCWAHIGRGGTSKVLFDPKIVMSHALLCGASGLILFHNHPSGNLTPSEPDRRLTSRMIQAGNVLDIQVLDHLIISHNKTYFRFADEGILY